MKPSAIRELARRYAAGELSLEDYRKQRRHLIDAVCAGTLKLQYGEAEPRRLKHVGRRWPIAIPVVIAIGIAIGVALHSGAHHHTTERQAPQPALTTDSGAQLLHAFTDTNDWSSASVSQFLKQWQQLPVREQRAARNSYLFPRLLAQLHEQIISQQAMLEIAPDPGAASRHLAQLQQLAATLDGKNPE